MVTRRFVIVTLTAGVVLISAAGPDAVFAASTAASEQNAVMATVHQFIDGINREDMKAAAAACASPASIVDDFPPHAWQGPTACADWATAFEADNKKSAITGVTVTLGKPWHVDVTGDRAYVVVPANDKYKQNGKPATESGSIFTVALKKFAAGWRITGWAWAQH